MKSLLCFGLILKITNTLGVPLSVLTFVRIAEKILKGAKKIGGSNREAIKWVEGNVDNKRAMLRVLENLIVLELVTDLKPQQEKADPKDYSRKITVNLKGFLLGELLFETYEKPGFWSKNFRKYKLALLAFYTAFAVLFLTIFLVFIEQLTQLVGTKNLIAISGYIQRSLGCSWWATITICFLIYLGLRHIWEKL